MNDFNENIFVELGKTLPGLTEFLKYDSYCNNKKIASNMVWLKIAKMFCKKAYNNDGKGLKLICKFIVKNGRKLLGLVPNNSEGDMNMFNVHKAVLYNIFTNLLRLLCKVGYSLPVISAMAIVFDLMIVMKAKMKIADMTAMFTGKCPLFFDILVRSETLSNPAYEDVDCWLQFIRGHITNCSATAKPEAFLRHLTLCKIILTKMKDHDSIDSLVSSLTIPKGFRLWAKRNGISWLTKKLTVISLLQIADCSELHDIVKRLSKQTVLSQSEYYGIINILPISKKKRRKASELQISKAILKNDKLSAEKCINNGKSDSTNIKHSSTSDKFMRKKILSNGSDSVDMENTEMYMSGNVQKKKQKDKSNVAKTTTDFIKNSGSTVEIPTICDSKMKKKKLSNGKSIKELPTKVQTTKSLLKPSSSPKWILDEDADDDVTEIFLPGLKKSSKKSGVSVNKKKKRKLQTAEYNMKLMANVETIKTVFNPDIAAKRKLKDVTGVSEMSLDCLKNLSGKTEISSTCDKKKKRNLKNTKASKKLANVETTKTLSSPDISSKRERNDSTDVSEAFLEFCKISCSKAEISINCDNKKRKLCNAKSKKELPANMKATKPLLKSDSLPQRKQDEGTDIAETITCANNKKKLKLGNGKVNVKTNKPLKSDSPPKRKQVEEDPDMSEIITCGNKKKKRKLNNDKSNKKLQANVKATETLSIDIALKMKPTDGFTVCETSPVNMKNSSSKAEISINRDSKKMIRELYNAISNKELPTNIVTTQPLLKSDALAKREQDEDADISEITTSNNKRKKRKLSNAKSNKKLQTNVESNKTLVSPDIARKSKQIDSSDVSKIAPDNLNNNSSSIAESSIICDNKKKKLGNAKSNKELPANMKRTKVSPPKRKPDEDADVSQLISCDTKKKRKLLNAKSISKLLVDVESTTPLLIPNISSSGIQTLGSDVTKLTLDCSSKSIIKADLPIVSVNKKKKMKLCNDKSGYEIATNMKITESFCSDSVATPQQNADRNESENSIACLKKSITKAEIPVIDKKKRTLRHVKSTNELGTNMEITESVTPGNAQKTEETTDSNVSKAAIVCLKSNNNAEIPIFGNNEEKLCKGESLTYMESTESFSPASASKVKQNGYAMISEAAIECLNNSSSETGTTANHGHKNEQITLCNEKSSEEVLTIMEITESFSSPKAKQVDDSNVSEIAIECLKNSPKPSKKLHINTEPTEKSFSPGSALERRQIDNSKMDNFPNMSDISVECLEGSNIETKDLSLNRDHATLSKDEVCLEDMLSLSNSGNEKLSNDEIATDVLSLSNSDDEKLPNEIATNVLSISSSEDEIVSNDEVATDVLSLSSSEDEILSDDEVATDVLSLSNIENEIVTDVLLLSSNDEIVTDVLSLSNSENEKFANDKVTTDVSSLSYSENKNFSSAELATEKLSLSNSSNEISSTEGGTEEILIPASVENEKVCSLEVAAETILSQSNNENEQISIDGLTTENVLTVLDAIEITERTELNNSNRDLIDLSIDNLGDECRQVTGTNIEISAQSVQSSPVKNSVEFYSGNNKENSNTAQTDVQKLKESSKKLYKQRLTSMKDSNNSLLVETSNLNSSSTNNGTSSQFHNNTSSKNSPKPNKDIPIVDHNSLLEGSSKQQDNTEVVGKQLNDAIAPDNTVEQVACSEILSNSLTEIRNITDSSPIVTSSPTVSKDSSILAKDNINLDSQSPNVVKDNSIIEKSSPIILKDSEKLLNDSLSIENVSPRNTSEINISTRSLRSKNISINADMCDILLSPVRLSSIQESPSTSVSVEDSNMADSHAQPNADNQEDATKMSTMSTTPTSSTDECTTVNEQGNQDPANRDTELNSSRDTENDHKSPTATLSRLSTTVLPETPTRPSVKQDDSEYSVDTPRRSRRKSCSYEPPAVVTPQRKSRRISVMSTVSEEPLDVLPATRQTRSRSKFNLDKF